MEFYHRVTQPEPLYRRRSKQNSYDDILLHMSDCTGSLHPRAKKGLQLFNAGEYFEAHEALEDAWNAEEGSAKNLYRGILQTAVVYLHITRGNYNGAIKVYDRSLKWLKDIPDICKGIQVGELKSNARQIMAEVQKLGRQRIAEFDKSLLKPVNWDEGKHLYICDRCGNEMHERNCKVTCPNCGNRFDCSDLNIYFD
jgi:predicted metal-dependent hydrolase